MVFNQRNLIVDTPPSSYKQLLDLELLRDEVSFDDPSIPAEDWITLNKEIERYADNYQVEYTAEQYDNLASGKAAAVNLTDVVEKFLKVDGNDFDFAARPFLNGLFNYFPKYSMGCKNMLLIASRQVGKSYCSDLAPSSTTGKQTLSTKHTYVGRVLMATGEYKKVADIQLGDEVLTYDMEAHKSSTGKVTWQSGIYDKVAYKITTRQGHQVTVGHEHPLYNGKDWIKAEDWKEGDRIAVVGAADYVVLDPETTEEDIHVARVLGHLVSEGSLQKHQARFHTGSAVCLNDFVGSLGRVGLTGYRVAKKSTAWYVDCHLEAREHLRAFGLQPTATSFTKHVPAWIWTKGPEIRKAFLSRLWSGDGSIKQVTKCKIEATYCSVSEQLIKEVQSLLWGFGIPSSIRVKKPTLYKETDKVAFELRIETQRGLKRFIEDIGALHKTNGIEFNFEGSNNNRDTLPKEILTEVIHEVFPKGNNQGGYLHGEGLARTPAYAPSRQKLQKYIEVAMKNGLDHSSLNKWASDHIYWDTVISVERIESKTCRDFTVEAEHNYVINGIITHNSTTQAAKSCGLGIVYPAFRTLYVAPRFDQLNIFSQQRVRPMCEDSDLMMSTFVRPGKSLWQVKARQFTNGSLFNFRSCYLSADNARGISANNLMIDEIQDIPINEIPVLEECQAQLDEELIHRLYAGTPKTTANVITRRWNETCQFEWLVKCQSCNYYNMCDETMLMNSKEFYSCFKCNAELFPKVHGVWVPKNPSKLDTAWGFRLSQFFASKRSFKGIMAIKNDPTVSRKSFMNEVLGLPFDDGEVGITDKILEERTCKDYHMHSPSEIRREYSDRGYKIYAGVDYGTGEGSMTVLTIGAMQRNGIFKVLFMKKFVGDETESVKELDTIDRICNQAGVNWIGADWGHGSHQNARLERERGWKRVGRDHVLMEFKYVTQKKEMTWNGKHYHADRNQSMERCIDAIRNCDEAEGIIFFNYGEFQPFKSDLTTITLEYNETTGNYKYVHQLPDDGFHSINYAYMAARQGSGLGLPSGYMGV